jgi:hypothetical protein
VTLVGLTGPVFVSEIGTTFSDYYSGLLVLGALVALTPAPAGRPAGHRNFAVAGFLVGAAFGLKLTNLIYVLGLAVSLAAMSFVRRLRARMLLSYAIGCICGFVTAGGYWAVHLWLATGNPVFPFYNAVFASPLFEAVNFADDRFVPSSVATASITYPFAWLLGMHPTSELPFRDARFALVVAFLPLALVVSALRYARNTAPGPDGLTTNGRRQFWLLSLFFGSSYVLWLAKFAIQRYALPLELLTGLMVYLSLDRVLRRPVELPVAFTLLALYAVTWARPPDWGRVPYANDWFGVAPGRARPPTLYVMMDDGQPTAYVIPFMSKADQFIRLTGNTPLEPEALLGRQALSIVAAHAGPIRSLSLSALDDNGRAKLKRFGLVPGSESTCETFQSRLDRFITCELTKTPQLPGS